MNQESKLRDIMRTLLSVHKNKTMAKSTFLIITRALYWLGHPVYFLLKQAFKNIIKTRKRILCFKIVWPKISLPKITLPKISWPKITWPTIKWQGKIKFRIFRWQSVLCLVAVFATFFYFSILRDLPDINSLATYRPALTTKIYDRNDKLLYKIYKNQNRTLVKLEDLPPYLIQATLAIEDADFYNHPGISLKGILRSARNYLFNEEKTGGSTITQQVVKNIFLTPERTLKRKIKEMILALLLELKYSKNQILERYFNEVAYGGANYGIEEASQTYFGKKSRDLTLAEAALLAGLPASPTTYSPFGINPQLAINRQHQVLRRMAAEGYLSGQKTAEVQAEPIIFASPSTEILAPHWVMFVKQLLSEKYGESMVEQGGLEIKTTLDLEIQKRVEQILKEEVTRQKYLNLRNGAVLIINPQNGEILAMAGSADYFDQANDGAVNVTLMPRSPGSAIKPLTYALALQNGFTLASILQDTPICYRVIGQPVYCPQDYDGKFRGAVTLRQALGSSLNLPAVKTLAALGVENLRQFGQKMGISTWEDSSRFGYSLTLGGGEVKMIDLVKIYQVLANGGQRQPIKAVITPESSGAEKSGELILSPSVAFLISHILADNAARAMVFGPDSPLKIAGHTISVKTGTTESKRDNWTIGYTRDYLVAVWVGNNDNSVMSPYLESGNSGAAPIWHRIMAYLLEGKTDQPLVPPESVVVREICAINGLLTCENCPQTIREYFMAGTEPTRQCRIEKKEENKEKDAKDAKEEKEAEKQFP